MPRRIKSPGSSKKDTRKPSNYSSDSDLLRMPRRLPSPMPHVPANDSINSGNGNDSMNASWNTTELKKRTGKANLFFDVMVEKVNLASTGDFNLSTAKGKSNGLSPSLKKALAKDMLAL
ncbi:MAG: hypothetical protein SGILL_010215 [Bacillariaceae sp.]